MEIPYITSKISKTIGVIARLRHFVPSSTMLTLDKSLVSPYLLCDLTVWGQASQIYLNGDCHFTYLLTILICHMLIEISIPLKELSMPN